MPIFEYQCFQCGSKFEDLVMSKSQEPANCSGCGSSSVERVYSTFAAQTSSSPGGESACYNQAAGICQAGGGPMACNRN